MEYGLLPLVGAGIMQAMRSAEISFLGWIVGRLLPIMRIFGPMLQKLAVNLVSPAKVFYPLTT